MAVSTTARFGITRWSDPADPFTRAQMDASHAQIEALGAIDVQDLLANRPAPGTRGRFFTETDGLAGVTWRDDGSSWRSVGSRVVAASATDVGQVVRGAASQSADLWQLQDSAGSLKASVPAAGYGLFPAGLFGGSGAVTTGPRNMFGVNGPSEVALGVRGAASQTGHLTDWQDSTGAVKSFIRNDGQIQTAVGIVMGATQATAGGVGGALTSTAGIATQPAMIAKGAASQSASIQEWQNSGGTEVCRIDPAGTIVGGTFYVNWDNASSWRGLFFGDKGSDSTNPGAGSGTLYCNGGALKWCGGNNTVTTIANA